jgi:threonine dehydrogenase-like Zn-dependent dehydrogenase
VDRNIRLAVITTHRFPLSKAEAAFALFNQGKTGKVIFEWD